jgi:hypothetical protein
MNNIGKRLDLYLSSWQSFDWSTSNCCHFCKGWLDDCGLSDSVKLIPEGLSELKAHRIIRDLGGFEATISHFLGKPAVGMPQLKVGDLILRPLENGRGSLGIVTGRYAAYCGIVGVEHLSSNPEQLGWRIQK